MTAQCANALEIQLQRLLRQLTHVHRLQDIQIQQLFGAALDFLQQSLLVNVLINKRVTAKIALAAILVVAILVVAILVVAIGVLIELLALEVISLLLVVTEITIAAIPALLTLGLLRLALLTLGLLRLALLTLGLLRLALLPLGLLRLALLTLGLLRLALRPLGLLRLALLTLGLLRLALGLLLLGRGRLLGRGLSGHCRLLGRGRLWLGRGRLLWRGLTGVVAILPGVSWRRRLGTSRLGGAIAIAIPKRSLFPCFGADAQWFFFRLYSWDSQGPASAARSRGGGLVGIFSLGIRGAIFVLTCHSGLNSSNDR
ncbi:MAG: hypothetical protein PHT80_07120 [Lentisphaeria bacterium]|nr:hypothetical protein [Lentisphaeria bacterium]